MSIFRPFQYKSKPDLLSDAPAKHGFFLFWEIFFRKFWRLITVNIYYFIITLPMLVLFHLAANSLYISFLQSSGLIEAYGGAEFIDIFPGIGFISVLATYIPEFLLRPLLILSIILYGPATMGITYVFRNFAREEHAWTTDLFSRGIANFKQGVFFGLLDVAVVCIVTLGYFGAIPGGTGIMPYITIALKTLSVLALIFYIFMRNYIYTMAVTVEIGVFHILKNAMIFAIIGFFRNIWALIVSVLAFIVCFMTVPILSLILVPFLYYSFTGFATVFICYPVIKKNIIIPILERDEKKKNEAASDSDGEIEE